MVEKKEKEKYRVRYTKHREKGRSKQHNADRNGLTVLYVQGQEQQEDEKGVKRTRKSGGREDREGEIVRKGRIRNRKRERKDNWNNERKEKRGGGGGAKRR